MTTQVRTTCISQDSGTGQPYRHTSFDPLDIPRQVVVLPPLLTRNVAAVSLFCDVWRRRRCSEWVCNVLHLRGVTVTSSLEIPHFRVRKHLAISPSRRLGHFHRSYGYLFPHIHPQRLMKMSSISDSGHHIRIPGTAVWPFSSTLSILQDYDRDQMLVHVMGINLCQYLDDWLIYSPTHNQCIRDTV